MKEVTDPAILAAFQQQNQQQAVTDPAVLAAFGIQPQHETNYIGAAWQGAKNMGAQMLDTGAVIGGAFPTIADNVETWATGVPTTARSDSYFQDVVMDGTQPMVEATQLNPNASTGEKVAFGLGNVAAALPTMLLSAPLAIGSKVPAALGMVAKGAAAMQPLAITGAVQESKRGIEAGVPIEEMGSVAVAKYLGTTAMGAVPVAAAGNMMTRGLTGAGLGVATGAAETALTNAAYGGAHQNMQTDIFNADDMTVNGALGAVLGAALGKRGNSTGNKTKADVEEETTLRGEGEQQAPLALPAPENQPIQGQVVDPPIANNPFAALEAPKQTSRVMPDGTIQQGTEADIKQGAAIDVSVGNQLLGLQQIFQNEAAITRQANAKNPLRNALPDNTVQPKALEAPRTVAASVTPDGVVRPVTQAEAWLNAQPAKPDTTGAREQQNAIHGRTNTSQLPPSSQANPFMDIMGGTEQFSPQAVETKRIAAEKQAAADAATIKKQERSQRAIEAAKKRKQISSADSLDVFVRKMGGVNDGDFAKAFHTKETGNKGANTHGALTRYSGKSADTMAEYAHEAGYIQERTPQALYDALELEINQGVKQHTPEQAQDQAEQDYNDYGSSVSGKLRTYSNVSHDMQAKIYGQYSISKKGGGYEVKKTRAFGSASSPVGSVTRSRIYPTQEKAFSSANKRAELEIARKGMREAGKNIPSIEPLNTDKLGSYSLSNIPKDKATTKDAGSDAVATRQTEEAKKAAKNLKESLKKKSNSPTLPKHKNDRRISELQLMGVHGDKSGADELQKLQMERIMSPEYSKPQQETSEFDNMIEDAGRDTSYPEIPFSRKQAKATDYVKADNGSDDFGHVPQAESLSAGAIKLNEGAHDFNTGTGYGLRHIEAKHGKEIRQFGYADAREFVADVAAHYSEIRKAGKDRVSLVKSGKRNSLLVVEFRKINGAYTVTTARIQKRKVQGKLLWNGRASNKPSIDHNQANTAATPTHQQKGLSDDGLAHGDQSTNTQSIDQSSTGMQAQEVKAMIKNGGMGKLLESGKIKVVKSASELSERVKRMVAWHGSPHDHDKFSTDNIGTGEGNQAYGYGLYFAGNKEVAEYYRDNIPNTEGDQRIKQLNAELSSLAKEMDKHKAAFNKAAEKLAKSEYDNVMSERFKLVRQKLDSKGKLYQVKLAPKQDEYLLWDKPLSEQSDKVKAAIGADNINDFETGADYYKAQSNQGRDTEDASLSLLSLGVRGIKYLDGSIRSKSEGDYSYVIFNDGDVSITEKYSRQGKVQGAYDPETDTIYMVADGLQKGDVKRVLAHEALHRALQRMANAEAGSKDAQRRANIFKGLEAAEAKAQAGDKVETWFKEAREAAQVDKDTPHYHEEIAAYAVEQFMRKPSSLPDVIKRWVKTLLAKVKQLIAETTGRVHQSYSNADFAAIASAELKRIGKEDQSGVGEVKKSTKQLRAPNGKPSKLNARQHAQVRTAEFKKWFGDWENDAANASKVVDENGEPLVVYHGTPLDFSIFDSNSWFTTDPLDANTYAEMTIPDKDNSPSIIGSFLSIKKPKIVEHYILKQDVDKRLNKLKRASGYIINQGKRKHYVVKNPSQIKSSTGNSGKFDAGNDDIRFSRSAAKSEEAEAKADYQTTKAAVTDYVHGKKDSIAKVAGAFWERLFYKPAQAVRDYGVEHARIIADKFLAEDRHEKRTTDMPDMMTQRWAETGKFTKRLQDTMETLSNKFVMFDMDASGLIRGLPSVDNMRIIRALRTGKVPKRLAKEAQALRDLLNDVRAYAIKAGLDIGELANYFPRVYDVERISKNKEKFIKFLEKHGYDNASAQRTMYKIINSEGSPELYGDTEGRITVNESGEVFSPRAQGKEGGASKKSYEKSRSVDIDEALLEKWLVNDIQAVLTQHINNVVRRAEYARRFGENEALLNAYVRKMVAELESQGRQSEVKKAVRDVYDMADATMGKYKPIENEFWRNNNRRLSDAMVMIHLPLVAFSSVPEFFAPLVHGGRHAVVPILKAAVVHGLNEGANSISKMVIGKRLWSKSEWTESAEQMGLITQAALAQAVQARMGHRTGKWTNRFIRATMLEQMTGLQKVMANETFKAMMKSHAKNLEKGVAGKKREQILQDIRDYGLSESQVKAWAKTGEGEAELRMAAVAFVNKVITTPNEANTPLHVQNPHFAQLMLFKRFITIFSNTFLKRMLQQSTRGKTTEAKIQGLIGAVLMMGAAYAAQSLRDDVKWGEEGSPFRKKDEVGKRMVDAFDRAGFSGSTTWLYAVVNPYRFGYTDKTSQRLFNLMGPAIGDATKTWDAFALTPKSKRKAAQKQGRQLSKLLPVVNATEATRKPFADLLAKALR